MILFIAPLSDPDRKDLLEIIEDRHGQSATVITSQYPTKEWHHLTRNLPSPMSSAIAYCITVTRLNLSENRFGKQEMNRETWMSAKA
jgi:hypothetical protein